MRSEMTAFFYAAGHTNNEIVRYVEKKPRCCFSLDFCKLHVLSVSGYF